MITVANKYTPEILTPAGFRMETSDTFTLSFLKKNPGHAGQFYMISRDGTGESDRKSVV